MGIKLGERFLELGEGQNEAVTLDADSLHYRQPLSLQATTLPKASLSGVSLADAPAASAEGSPVAVDDEVETDEDTAVTIDLLANDLNVSGVEFAGLELLGTRYFPPPTPPKPLYGAEANVIIGSDGVITFEPAGFYDGLAEGETITEFLTYFIRRAPTYVDEGVFELSTLLPGNSDAQFGVVLLGGVQGDRAGWDLADIGDLNGDGIDDFIIGAPAFLNHPAAVQLPRAGKAFVVFGDSDGLPATIDLHSLDGLDGFVVEGISVNDRAGYTVSGAGDVNGDGIDDLIIGAPRASDGIGAFVVYGSDAGFDAMLRLGELDGTDGFRILKAPISGGGDLAISEAGDVNGDGIDDLLIGVPSAAVGENSYAGQVHVIYGKADGFGSEVDLSAIATGDGSLILGLSAGDRAGASVSSVGDVNGDGIDDFVIGAPQADGDLVFNSGQSYVVFGSADGLPATLSVSALDGTNGFALNGAVAANQSGASVSAAGDVNGDGIGDIIIGTDTTSAHAAFVLYGSSEGFGAEINLGSLASGDGFAIRARQTQSFTGYDVDGVGDINGDGYDDLVVGAPQISISVDDPFDPLNEESGGRPVAGETYIIFGGPDEIGRELFLFGLDGNDAIAFRGIDAFDFSGRSVSAAGDVNGDGLDDLLIGADQADPNGIEAAGEAYVVFGRTDFRTILESGSISFTVSGVNDAPDAQDDVLTSFDGSDIDEDDEIAIFPLRNDDDAEGDELSLVSLSAANVKAHVRIDDASVILFSARGNYEYLGAGEVVSESFTYTVADAHGAVSSASITVVINGVQDDPNQTLSGTDVNDTLVGGDGADDIFGRAGADQLNGGGGADTLAGSAGRDTLNGQTGNDDLFGGRDADRLVGADGDDLLIGSLGDDELFGGAGTDNLQGGDGFDTLAGGDGADLLFGGQAGDQIFGGLGNDTGFGGNGDDLLTGFDGDDEVQGNLGRDTVYGGLGNDLVSGGNGQDFGAGNSGADSLFGGLGNDTLDGGLGDDEVAGGDQDDQLSGNVGDDTVFGGDGQDTVIGGDGNDSLFGNDGADSGFGGAGNDTLNLGAGDDLATGNAGDDILLGTSGNDTLIGGEGRDSLVGGNDNDSLVGNQGADTLIGGNGADTLNGGNDHDVFVFSGASGADQIIGFVAGAGSEDVIALNGFGTGLDNFAEVQAAASDDGADTVIDLGGGNTITLVGVVVADLHEDDFLFG